MDDQARAAYEEQSLQLRVELKKWEGDWATAHEGKKPGRDDIKQNRDIARKYKQYNKLRDILAGKAPPPRPGPVEATHGHHQRKRTQSDAALPPQTPSKRSKPAQTHSQVEAVPSGAQTPSAARAVLTPSLNRAVLTPVAAVPTSISPTPQKDGRVLGIFDLLGRTPSRSTNESAPAAKGTLLAATPSKPRTTDPLPPTTALTPTTARFATTPQSKRTTTTAPLFQSSTTPSHYRHAKPTTTATTTVTTPFKTPSANRVSKHPVNSPTASSTGSTPSFLRRRKITTTAAVTASVTALTSVDEQDENAGDARWKEGEEEAWKKIGPLRLPRKLGVGIGRSLSSVVAGLRKMEEEAFGEEEEVLREMEMEAGGNGAGVRGSVVGAATKGVGGVKGVGGGEVEVGDSQAQVRVQSSRDLPDNGGKPGEAERTEEAPVGLLSGFDDELYGSSDEDTQQTQNQPLRTFKKRGQKRTTRLVNMRPTRAKRPALPENNSDQEEEDEIIHETQFNISNPATTANDQDNDLRLSDLDSASEVDFDGASDSEEEGEGDEAASKTKQKKPAPGKDKSEGKEKSGGVVKRAVRKVKATAHANFKRLKLRNSGAKGGPGYGSRWRRMR